MAAACRLVAFVAAASLSGCGACDCSWTGGGANCGTDDGSPCWTACCGGGGGGGGASGGCSNARWSVAYSPEKCHMASGNAIITCASRSGSECGTRLSSNLFVGQGSHKMGIKAAPGAGVATTFYLSNNGGLYDKTKTHPWVELDFEIFGRTAGGHSKIWTNMLTGIAVENWKWITVPFDVTTDYHTYGFVLDEESVRWTVDGVTYRQESIVQLPDAVAAMKTSAFQEFISVWGKNSNEPGEGIPEFRAGLGVLDQNANRFPIDAGYRLPL